MEFRLVLFRSKLNVSNRIEAARILAVNGVFDDVTPYQPLTYQLIDLGEVPPAADADAGRSSFRRFFKIGSPFPTASQPANRHGLMARIIWPVLARKSVGLGKRVSVRVEF